MPSLTLTGAISDRGLVLATMLFPADPVNRNAYSRVFSAGSCLDGLSDDSSLTVTAGELRFFLNAPSLDSLKTAAREATKRGVVAGDVLASLYVMHRFHEPEPSMNKAVWVSRQFAKETTYGDGSPMHTSDRMVREAWTDYKSVAHLWAASRLNQSYQFTPTKFTFDELGFEPFLEVAAELLVFGTTFVPTRSKVKESLLDPQLVWDLPDIYKARRRRLVSDRAPKELLRYLSTYKAPSAY